MSHFLTVVIVPGDTEPSAIEQKVSDMLAPFYEGLKVEPYKKYLSQGSIEVMAKHCRLSISDLASFVPHIEDWECGPGGLDEQGLFYMSTRNPNLQWDWWSFGGRWNGAVRNARRSDESGLNFSDEYRQLNENMLPVKLLDHKLTCWAVLTPDGEWHEKASMGWFGMSSDNKDEKEWDEEVLRLIRQHPDDILVGVDCHI